MKKPFRGIEPIRREVKPDIYFQLVSVVTTRVRFAGIRLADLIVYVTIDISFGEPFFIFENSISYTSSTEWWCIFCTAR